MKYPERINRDQSDLNRKNQDFRRNSVTESREVEKQRHGIFTCRLMMIDFSLRGLMESRGLRRENVCKREIFVVVVVADLTD